MYIFGKVKYFLCDFVCSVVVCVCAGGSVTAAYMLQQTGKFTSIFLAINRQTKTMFGPMSTEILSSSLKPPRSQKRHGFLHATIASLLLFLFGFRRNPLLTRIMRG